MKKCFGFTLAELMIVLSVIGVLAAILLPAARNAMPNQDLMKFKKGHSTLTHTIRELVNSDKYYKNGDLGIKADGTMLYSKASYHGCGTEFLGNDSTVKYFCETFADIVNTKSVNCSTEVAGGNDARTMIILREDGGSTGWGQTYANAKILLDRHCKQNASIIGPEIVTSDNITYYQTDPNGTFGIIWSSCTKNDVLFNIKRNAQWESPIYKPFCMDIDGIAKGEDPFGFGIRADGTILNGARASEWLKKSINGKD
ncbi:MAG: type II secretion system protein [Candidatus Gastranaerophilales bacterium]|nr:type II secretion system protein [Candidatus Gastranaerophilales bacterium]